MSKTNKQKQVTKLNPMKWNLTENFGHWKIQFRRSQNDNFNSCFDEQSVFNVRV